MCQSLAEPSLLAEYWHIGAITIRFLRESGPKEIGEKSVFVINCVV